MMSCTQKYAVVHILGCSGARFPIYFIGLIMPNLHPKSPPVFTETKVESRVGQDSTDRQGLTQWSISKKSEWGCPYQGFHRLLVE